MVRYSQGEEVRLRMMIAILRMMIAIIMSGARLVVQFAFCYFVHCILPFAVLLRLSGM